MVFLTSGEKGGHGRSPEKTRRLREREACRAAKILGTRPPDFWGEPDGALRPTPALIHRLCDTLREWKPEMVYLPHDREMHPDHRATVRLLRAALAGRQRPKLTIRMFEVWTPIQRLDEIVDISPFMKKKLAAIRAYRSQCEVLAFDEAVLGLNRYRGEMHCWPGGDFAEVFTHLSL